MWLINLCCFTSITLFVWGCVQIRLKKLEDEDRSMNLGKGFLINSIRPLIQIVAYFVNKISAEKANRKYSKKLLVSGNKLHLIPAEFVALKWLSASAGMGAGIYIVMMAHINFLAIVFLALFAYFYPDLWLHEKTAKRKAAISKELPFCMDLLALSAYIKFMVTGVVLLVAVTIDAYSRSRRQTAGQA